MINFSTMFSIFGVTLLLIVNINQISAGIISLSSFNYFAKNPRSVPYLFDETFVDIRLQQRVSDAIEQLSAQTCVEFTWLSETDLEPNKTGYLLFVQHPDAHQCVSQNGLKIGATVISLGSGCGTEILACLRAILYALGVEYEHLRQDRNQYVNINLSNVKTEALHLFTKTLDVKDYRTVTSYDLSSIMHFGPQEHAKFPHQHPVVSSRNDILQPSVGSNIRQKHDLLSFRDKKTINELIHCSSSCDKKDSCLHGGYMDKQCRCVCSYGFTGESCQLLLHHFRYNVPDCGQVSGQSGDIVSPNYPLRYPRGAFCQWLVQGTRPTDIIVFKINNFDLEHENVLPSDRCLDKLFVWVDGTDVITKHLSCLPDDSSKYVNKWFSSQYDWLLIELRTDPWGQYEHIGFNITYRIIDTSPPPDSQEQVDSEEERTLSNYTKRLQKHIGERRLYCHECHNYSHCEYSNRDEMFVQCSTKEACAFKINGINHHVWRGCAAVAECTNARKVWFNTDIDDYMDCCADDFCNIYENGTPKKSSQLMVMFFIFASLQFVFGYFS